MPLKANNLCLWKRKQNRPYVPKILDTFINHPKISRFSNVRKIQEERNLNFDIEIDGGINFDNYKTAIKAGANILVSGTTIFKSNNGDIKKNIELNIELYYM